MKPIGFKVVLDQNADGGVRVNFFANEPMSGDYARGKRDGIRIGQRSRTKKKKVWI